MYRSLLGDGKPMGKVAVVGANGFSGMKAIVIHPSSDKPMGVHENGHDPKDIDWGINGVLGDSRLRKARGSNARQWVLENFALDEGDGEGVGYS